MTESVQCRRCGGPLLEEVALGGGCPRCMLELGFETSPGSLQRLEPAATDRPAVIGRYRILRLIGEGGMGAVYEAEQDHPRRTVALKIIKSGMASAELLRRFEQEAQALGRLQHPGIAQIYEAGTVDTGFGPQPYFAMEFIRGRTPREYAEEHRLSARDRLQMMVKICDAVHHAHQRGLIHRDLKPANILVDETGMPKILDFGVARVTDSDTRATLQTDVGQLVGTLAYMSPEQALADPLDIDTRSDVYSLGVILYELLAGRLPYTISKKVHEAVQAIREEDPARLSISNRTFRGDIETIVAKALEKERERRYASAAELAADIQRYLNDDPIVARRPSASYQLQKFARRNKTLVSGIAAVFVVLIAGIAIATSLLMRARIAETDARRDRDRADRSMQEAIEAGLGREAYFWDVATGKINGRLELDNNDLPFGLRFPVQFSRDGKLAASSVASIIEKGISIPTGIGIYDTATGQRLRRLNVGGPGKTTFTPDGNGLLVVDGRSMTIWNIRTGMKLVSFPEAGNPGTILMGTDFSPDGTRLVSVSSDGEVWLWEAQSGKPVLQLRESSGPFEVREFDVIAEKFGAQSEDGMGLTQYSIAFSPDGRKIMRTTVSPDAKGAIVRIETWDGSLRRK